jgi:hypothetical protein
MNSVLSKLSFRSVVFGALAHQRRFQVVSKFSNSSFKCSTMACKMFLEFPNGQKMPQLGLGTWQVRPDKNVVVLRVICDLETAEIL